LDRNILWIASLLTGVRCCSSVRRPSHRNLRVPPLKPYCPAGSAGLLRNAQVHPWRQLTAYWHTRARIARLPRGVWLVELWGSAECPLIALLTNLRTWPCYEYLNFGFLATTSCATYLLPLNTQSFNRRFEYQLSVTIAP
jgi:hypothetical protein